MNFLNQLTTHKIVEPNKLTGLRTGHIIAQAPYRQVAAETYLDNGVILFLDENAELVLGSDANAKKAQPFLHYTEELMNGPVLGTKYFTVDLDDAIGATPVCYPRAIALYEGDEFTTTNYSTALTLAAGTNYWAYFDYAAGDFEVVAAYPVDGAGLAYVGPIFLAKKDTLAAGEAAVHLTLIEKMADIAAV